MKTYKSRLTLLLFAVFLFSKIYSQDTIYFENPSFEDIPRLGHTPKGWTNCGFAGETPPDTQSSFLFPVSSSAYDGNTYLGMVVRDNNTWESVGTELSAPLKKDSAYQFEIKLAKLSSFRSLSRTSSKPANYNAPVSLRIWGGTRGLCERGELLAESSLVNQSDWEQYRFYIRPTLNNVQFIMLEVYYETSEVAPYNGNLLLDNASPFILSDVRQDLPPIIQPPLIEYDPKKKLLASPLAVIPPITPRSLEANAIDPEQICHFIQGLFLDQEAALLNIAHCATRKRWTIAVSGERTAQTIHSLNKSIAKLKLARNLKVIDYKNLPEDAVFLCVAQEGASEIGIYY